MARESVKRASAATALDVSSTIEGERAKKARKRALGPDPQSVIGNGREKLSDF